MKKTMESSSSSAPAPTAAEEKKVPVYEVLEEDDEFEVRLWIFSSLHCK